MRDLSLFALPLVLLFGANARANEPAAAEALFRDGRALHDLQLRRRVRQARGE